MMMRPADAKQTVVTYALFGLAGVAAVAAVWHFVAPARAPQAAARPAVSAMALPAAEVAAPDSASAARPGSLPVSLTGSMPPRLPLDARGHLAKVRGVRDFFDYFLAAQNELPATALDALVRKRIAAQLDGTVAQAETLDVWQRYQSYRQALARLAPLAAPIAAPIAASDGSRASQLDLDAMQSSLDERVSLASRTLGADWSEAFFGSDWRRAHYAIERLRIVRDPALSDAQKAARLQALDTQMPAQERGVIERGERSRATVDAIARLRQQGMSTDQLRAKATQEWGPQAAERIVKMQQDEDAWRAKYADYASQRARIEAMGLTAAERDAQIAQLREHAFANVGERLRAASLDLGSAH